MPPPSAHDTDPDAGETHAGCRDDNEVEPFPVDALPPVMRRIVESTAMATQLPPSLAAAAALATLAASMGAGLQVRDGRHTTMANLAILIGLGSGLGKDDVYRYIVRPLVELDSRLRKLWEREVKPRLLERLDEAKRSLRRMRSQRSMGMDVTAEMIRDCESDIAEIQRQLIRCPKLAMTAPGKIQLGLEMMNQDGEACAILTPEGRDSVFKTGDEGFYSAAFSGSYWEDARVTRESICIERPCLTVLLMAQPDFISRQIEREKMVVSGLMPRFLTLTCSPELPDVPLDPPVIPENGFGVWGRLEVFVREFRLRRGQPAVVEANRDADMHLAAYPSVILENNVGEWGRLLEEVVRTFRLRRGPPAVIEASRDVDRLFAEYENETRARRRDGGDAVDIQPFAARWTENAVRIAAVLHVGEYGAAGAIVPLSAATARYAIRISRWFVNRQLEALALARNGWLRRRAGELRQKLLNFPESQTTLGILAKAGWTNDEVRMLAKSCPDLITIERRPTGSRGGRPTEHVKAA